MAIISGFSSETLEKSFELSFLKTFWWRSDNYPSKASGIFPLSITYSSDTMRLLESYVITAAAITRSRRIFIADPLFLRLICRTYLQKQYARVFGHFSTAIWHKKSHTSREKSKILKNFKIYFNFYARIVIHFRLKPPYFCTIPHIFDLYPHILWGKIRLHPLLLRGCPASILQKFICPFTWIFPPGGRCAFRILDANLKISGLSAPPKG